MDDNQRAQFEAILGQVIAAIDVVLSNVVSSVERTEKHKWLEEFGREAIAWNIAVDLLTRDRYSIFGAEMLTTKIKQSWMALEGAHKKELCDVVLANLLLPSTGPSLSSSLCKTIAAIIYQSAPHDWPDPIADTLYLSQVTAESPRDTRTAWIDLVRTVATEINQTVHGIPTQQHETLKTFLRGSPSDIVINTLQDLIAATAADHQSNIASEALAALRAWFETGVALHNMFPRLVDTIISAILVNPDDLAQSGAEAFQQLLENHAIVNYPSLLVEMLPHVLRLELLLHQALAADDASTLTALLTLFCSIGINHSSVLLDNPDFGAQIASFICIACQNRSAITSEVWDFWDALQKDLEKTPEFDDLLDAFRPAFEEMARMALNSCRQVVEEDAEDVETDQDLKSRRGSADDCLQAFYTLIPEEMSAILNGLLREWLTRYQQECQAATSTSAVSIEVESWLELALWGWSTVSLEFTEDDEEGPLGLLHLFDSLPTTSYKIRKAALTLINHLCHWLELHPDALPMALNYTVNALEVHDLTATAIATLQSICNDCGDCIPPLLDDLMQRLEVIVGGLNPKEQCQVIGCLASQVTYLEPQQGLNLLVKLAGTLPGDLLALVQETNSFNLLQRTRLMDGLGVINALLVTPGDLPETSELSNRPQHYVMVVKPPTMTANERYSLQVEWAQVAMLPFVEQTWPIADAIVNAVEVDEDICKVVIKYISKCQSCLKRLVFAPFLPRALQLLQTIFRRTASTVIFKEYAILAGVYRTKYQELDIRRLLPEELAHIVELGLVPPAPSASIENPPSDVVLTFGNAFSEITNLVLGVVAQSSGAEELDIIMHYMQHCVSETVHHMPRAFFASVQHVLQITQFALQVLPHLSRESEVRIFGRYFRALFENDFSMAISPQDLADFTEFKNNMFETLLEQIFCGIAGGSPRSQVGGYSEIVFYFLTSFPSMVATTLQSLFSRPGFPSNNVSPEQKQMFYSRILQAQRSNATLDSALRDFAVLCRGIPSAMVSSLYNNPS